MISERRRTDDTSDKNKLEDTNTTYTVLRYPRGIVQIILEVDVKENKLKKSAEKATQS